MDKRKYEVGFGRPPEAHKWKKGQSGNPGGARRRSDFQNDVTEILGEVLSASSGGREIALPSTRAMFRKLCLRAMRNDDAALREAITQTMSHEDVLIKRRSGNGGDIDPAAAKRHLFEKLEALAAHSPQPPQPSQPSSPVARTPAQEKESYREIKAELAEKMGLAGKKPPKRPRY